MERIQYTIILFLLLMPGVFAKAEMFNTRVNVTWANNICTVETEDRQIRTYSSAVTDDRITINIMRNTSCREEQLYDFIENVFVRENETEVVREQLNNCTIKRDRCLSDYDDDVYLSANVTYKSKYETCNTQLSTCQANANTASTCQTQLQKAESDKSTWGIGGLIIGAVVCYMMNKKNLAQGPTSRLPPSR